MVFLLKCCCSVLACGVLCCFFLLLCRFGVSTVLAFVMLRFCCATVLYCLVIYNAISIPVARPKKLFS